MTNENVKAEHCAFKTIVGICGRNLSPRLMVWGSYSTPVSFRILSTYVEYQKMRRRRYAQPVIR